jgi:hypothetical protein
MMQFGMLDIFLVYCFNVIIIGFAILVVLHVALAILDIDIKLLGIKSAKIVIEKCEEFDDEDDENGLQSSTSKEIKKKT